MSITIDKEFESLIPPLSPEEFAQLEENCVKEGIRDALITWNGILVDGHNRFRIAAKHGLHWNEKQMQFADRDEAIAWIASNQLGRRNLHPLDKERLLSTRREALERQAKERQGTRTDLNIRENFPRSERPRDIIGKEIGVSGRQVDKLHAINEKATDRTKQLVREGKLSINQAYNSLHPKRPDPIKQAKEEHETFEQQKNEAVINLQAVQNDKVNKAIIDNALMQEILKMLNTIDKFGMEHKTEELRCIAEMVADDEKQIYKQRIESCQLILEKIKSYLIRRN